MQSASRLQGPAKRVAKSLGLLPPPGLNHFAASLHHLWRHLAVVRGGEVALQRQAVGEVEIEAAIDDPLVGYQRLRRIEAMSAASFIAAGTSSSGSTTRFTSPHASAVFASRKLPLSESSLAR